MVLTRDIAAWIKKQKLGKDVKILVQVHDELIFEIKKKKVKETIPKLVSLMEAVLNNKETHGVPLVAEVKVGENWHDLKDYNV